MIAALMKYKFRCPGLRLAGAMLPGLLCIWCTGCAALTNPVANGVPVRRLPPELLSGPSREAMITTPLTLLKQPTPDIYRLAAGDVLGMYIEGVLPATSPNPNAAPSNPPVYFPSQIDPLSRGLPPALGFPIPIRDDGTIDLPLVDAIQVQGMSITEAADAVRRAYMESGILQAGRERVIVTVMQPRRTRVLVFRQETGGFSSGGRGDIAVSNQKRGTGHVVDLRAYENDVLNALTESGGLPGLDAYSNVIVFKGAQRNPIVMEALETLPAGRDPLYVADLCPKVVIFPTRIMPGQPLPFRPQDVILEEGDIVFLEARAVDLFYTGGLLPAAEFVLPRDYDLDVVEAIAQVRGTLVHGAFGGNALAGNLIQPGLGNPNPSRLTVLRRIPEGGHLPIQVDLNLALRDSRERINIQAGDVLILQETPGEAVARYITQTFTFSLVSRVISRGDTTGTASLFVP